jgi:hypothetical protein
MVKLSACLFVAALLLGRAAHSHHSFPVHYIPEKMISISGVVGEFRYVNPHAVVFLAVKDEQGAEQTWSVEWAGSSALRRRGVLPGSIAAGDRVTIEGNPARDGSHSMRLNILSFADGRAPIGPPNRAGTTDNED